MVRLIWLLLLPLVTAKPGLPAVPLMEVPKEIASSLLMVDFEDENWPKKKPDTLYEVTQTYLLVPGKGYEISKIGKKSTCEEKLDFTYEGSSNCPDLKNGKIRLDNLLVEKIDRSNIALTGDFVLETPIDENLMVRATIARCPSKTERGMCEDLPSSDMKDTCEKLPKKNETWSPFIQILKGFDPHCPVKVGSYHFERFPVSLDQMSSMPMMEGYWVIKTEGFLEKEKVMCMLTECEFKPARGKKKKKVG